MSKKTDRIFLIYNLQKQFKNEYQGIYYAHILGSTFAIGAKFYNLKKVGGEILSLKADFRSITMDGILNFSVKKIEEDVNYQVGNSRFNLDVKLQLSEKKGGQNLKGVELRFEKPWNLERDHLRISVPMENDKIDGITKGMIINKATPIDNDRSCFVKLGGG